MHALKYIMSDDFPLKFLTIFNQVALFLSVAGDKLRWPKIRQGLSNLKGISNSPNAERFSDSFGHAEIERAMASRTIDRLFIFDVCPAINTFSS